jgi:ABC-type multidrug transport system fused ATPase/permease subunit
MDETQKKTVWANIFRLIVPYRKKFLWVVTLSLLSTGASLIEPLIYRTAINDVAGLFVRQARLNAQKDLGVDPGEADSIQSLIRSEVSDSAATVPTRPAVKTPEPHALGHVAARSPRQALDTLLWAVVWLFVINLIATLLWRLAENTNTRLSCLIEQRFIQNTFAHVLRLPLSFFSRRPSAAIAKQIDQSEEVTGVVNGFSQQILPELISLIGILAIMFWQNVALTTVALITIPVYVLIAWHSAKKLETGLADYYSRWEEVSSRIQDGLTGIKTVKLSGSEDREVDRLQTAAGTAYKDYIKRAQLSNKYVFWETILSHLSTALVFGYGGYLTLENRLTPGDVVMFVAYLDRLYGPIDALASLWVELQQNVASIARAFRLLDNGEEEKEGHQLKFIQGRIEFRDVRFGYTAEREVLKGVSFTLYPGCVTAIVGGSGAGKTTTMDLLMKLYEPTAGAILIDGQDLRTLDPSSLRSQIGVVSTDGAVFRGTLADNIRYKNPGATEDEVWEAAMAAGLHSTLDRLPEGLATPVGESGIGLSVGERQRIQIARMLAAHTRIVVLDEATANLDYATEEEVRRTIDRIRHKATVIIIAHRFSMVRDADQVIVLGEGLVQEAGTPTELLETNGWFARFAAATEQSQPGPEEAGGEPGDVGEEDDSDVGEEVDSEEEDDIEDE